MSLFLIKIGISAVLSLEISSLCFLHQSSKVQSVFTTVVRTAGREGPSIISSMSSANVAISRFGALDSNKIRSLIMTFQRVGPETDPCGQPTGYLMHQQFNIQQLYAVPTLYLCVLYLSQNKQRLVPLTAKIDWFL